MFFLFNTHSIMHITIAFAVENKKKSYSSFTRVFSIILSTTLIINLRIFQFFISYIELKMT